MFLRYNYDKPQEILSILDKVVLVTCLLVLGAGLGYGWRMHHEYQETKHRIDPEGWVNIRDLSMEIGKKQDFYLYVDSNTMLHFMPLRKARFEMAVRREER